MAWHYSKKEAEYDINQNQKGSSLLFVDFHYMGKRCRETTNLTGTPANRKKLAKVLEKMEAEILLGSFRYEHYFPKSNKAAYFDALNDRRLSLLKRYVVI